MADESWAVEEYCEDAIAAYLTSKITAESVEIYTAWTDTEIKYPCAIVHAGVSRNVGESEFNGVREIEVSIAVMSEAHASGTTTARNVNRAARNEIVKALAYDNLHTEINTIGTEGVTFSYAMLTAINRSVEADKRAFVSEISLHVIATAVEITTTTTTTTAGA